MVVHARQSLVQHDIEQVNWIFGIVKELQNDKFVTFLLPQNWAQNS